MANMSNKDQILELSIREIVNVPEGFPCFLCSTTEGVLAEQNQTLFLKLAKLYLKCSRMGLKFYMMKPIEWQDLPATSNISTL